MEKCGSCGGNGNCRQCGGSGWVIDYTPTKKKKKKRDCDYNDYY